MITIIIVIIIIIIAIIFITTELYYILCVVTAHSIESINGTGGDTCIGIMEKDFKRKNII